MKYLIIILSILFLSSCNTDITELSEFGSGDDYKIYSEILKTKFPGTQYLFILNDSTSGERYDVSNSRNITEEIPGLLEETFRNYCFVNGTSYKLKKIPGIDKIVFASEYIYTQKDTNSVRVWFSKIGYDNKKRQAMVTMGESVNNMDGEGSLIILQRKGSIWEIVRIQLTWIA